MTNRAEYIEKARAKYNSYNTNEWEKSYFDENTGGFIVIENVRITQSQKSKNEKEKFEKECGMCMVL